MTVPALPPAGQILSNLPPAGQMLDVAQKIDSTIRTTGEAYQTFRGSMSYLHENMGGAPNSSGKRSRVEQEVVTNAKTGKCRLRGCRKRTSRNVSSLIEGRSMFGAPLLPVLGEKQLTSLRVNCGNKEYPNQLQSFLDMCLGVSAKTRTSFAGRITAPQGVRTYHHELYRHNYSLNDSATASVYPSNIRNAGRILTPETEKAFDPTGPGTAAGTVDTSFRDMSAGTTATVGTVYYTNYNRTDLEDLSWNQQRIRLAEDDASLTTTPTTLTIDASVPQLQADIHRRWGAIANVNKSFTLEEKPMRGLFKACINYGKISYNFMNKGEGGCEVTVIVSKFKKSHLMSSSGIDYLDHDYPVKSSVDAIANGWLETMKANYSVQDFNGRDVHFTDVTTNPCFPFLPQLTKTRQADVDIKEVCRQNFAMPAGARRELTIDLPGEVFNPLDFPVSSASTTPNGRGILNNMTYCITIAVNGTKATRFVHHSSDNALQKDEGGYVVGDMHGPVNLQYYSTYQECVGPSIFTCPKKILLANEGGLMNPTDEFSVGFNQKTGVMLDQSASVRVAPKVTKTFNLGGYHTGTNVEEGTATIGNESNERR